MQARNNGGPTRTQNLEYARPKEILCMKIDVSNQFCMNVRMK
jgi:hypothetical protein